MYKIIIFILILFPFSQETCGQSERYVKNDLEKEGLKGKVKSITEYTYESDTNGIKKDTLLVRFIYHFNRMGQRTEEFKFMGKHTNYYQKTIYEYNSDDQLIGEKIFDDGRLSENLTIAFDDYHRIKKALDCFDGGSYCIDIYDENGNNIEHYAYRPDSSMIWKHYLKYDNRGNMIEENQYFPNGKLEMKFTHQYNEKGFEILEKDFNPDNSLDIMYTWEYDINGNIIRFNNSAFEDQKNTFTYHFDSIGNWIKKIKETNNRKTETTERIIDYYKD